MIEDARLIVSEDMKVLVIYKNKIFHSLEDIENYIDPKQEMEEPLSYEDMAANEGDRLYDQWKEEL